MMNAPNPLYTITKKDGIVTLTPKGTKHQNALIFLHGWGQSGSQWQDYFASGGAVPQVKPVNHYFLTICRTLR